MTLRRWVLVDTLDGREIAQHGRFMFRWHAERWAVLLNALALPSSRRLGYRLVVRRREAVNRHG